MVKKKSIVEHEMAASASEGLGVGVIYSGDEKATL